MKTGTTSALLIATAALFTPFAAFAQQLTPEQQAIYDQMVRSMGGDPAQIKAATAQAQIAQQFGDVVRYSVVGIYNAQTNVSSEPNWLAYADVTDRVEGQFDWKVSEGQLIGTPAMQNHPSKLANARNPEAKCAPPKINGPFEYDLKQLEQGIGATLRLKIQSSFPPVQVHQMCTGALKAMLPKQTMGVHELMVPPPTMLAMALPPTGDITRSADGKSLVLKQGGWTWTFTPRQK